LWMFQRVIFGDLSEFLRGLGHHLVDTRPVEILTLAPLGALVVVFGILPVLLLKLVAPTVDGVLDDVSKGTAMTLAFWR
jgi:NADH:ubiquinone oxidoreductase subunit 4 (subunit M)